MAATQRAIIIGAGIGGLTAAIALRRAGLDVAVYEQAPELHDVGAGITLWANALRALERIDMAGPVRQVGVATTTGAIRAPDGRALVSPPTAALLRRFGTVAVAVHRADLQSTLFDALGAGRVHLGKRCVGYEQGHDRVTTHFADGSTAQGDLLVGADGLHSAVRTQLLGAEPPHYAGYTAWRGVASFAHEHLSPGYGFETWGCGQRFGLVQIGRGRVYWFATHNTPAGGSDGAHGRKHDVQQLFRGWHAPIEALIDATAADAILRNDIYDRDPAPRWGEQRVTLLGDAAHPTTPNLGQGACMAIEDAVALGSDLQQYPPVQALRTYERRRMPRTSEVVLRSRRIGQIGQLHHPLACWFRNRVISLTPNRALLRQAEWALGYEV